MPIAQVLQSVEVITQYMVCFISTELTAQVHIMGWLALMLGEYVININVIFSTATIIIIERLIHLLGFAPIVVVFHLLLNFLPLLLL